MPPLQFTPPPDFSKLENLVPEIKLPSFRIPNIPLRNLSTAPDDDDKTRDMMLAMILGASAPLLEKGATALAGVIPGISGLLEPKEVEQPSAVERVAALREKAKEIYEGDPVAQEAYIKSRQAARAAIPDSPVPPKDTLTKSAVEMLGGLAPAAALKTSAGAGVFADMFSKRVKAKSDEALIDAQDRLETIRDRKKLQGQLFKGFVEDQTPIKFFGVHPVTGRQISRNGVQVRGDRFVISQGTDYDTVPGSTEIIPAGQKYLNPILTANTSSEKRKAEIYQMYMKANGKEISLGYNRLVTLPGGRDENQLFIMTPDGDKRVTGNNIWLPISSEQAFDKLSKRLKSMDASPEMLELWGDYTDGLGITYGTMAGINVVLNLGEEHKEALTYAGDAIALANTLKANLKGVEYLFGDTLKQLEIDFSDHENATTGARMLRLKQARDEFEADPGNKAKEAAFDREFYAFSDLVNKDYANDPSRYLGTGFKLKTRSGEDKIGETASARARLNSQLLQLAYQAAATTGQTGRTLSDKDLAFFLKIVGYGEQDFNVLQDKLLGFADQTEDGFNNKTSPQIAHLRKTPDELDRYLRTSNIGITDELLTTAKQAGEEGDKARQEVKDRISIGASAASQFFIYEQDEKSKKYQLIIPTFRQLYKENGRLKPFFRRLDSFREKEEKGEKPDTGSYKSNLQVQDELERELDLTATAPIDTPTATTPIVTRATSYSGRK